MLINILRRESWVRPLILFQTSAFHCSFSAEASHQHREVSDPMLWDDGAPILFQYEISALPGALYIAMYHNRPTTPTPNDHQDHLKKKKTPFQISPCMIASLLMLLPGPPLLGHRGNIVVKNTHRVLIFSLCHTCYRNWPAALLTLRLAWRRSHYYCGPRAQGWVKNSIGWVKI